MSILRSVAIKNWLDSQTHPDLADLYNSEMEVQVEVARDGGERVGNKGSVYQDIDRVDKWYSFRMPKNPGTEPEDNDGIITYDLAEHANGIGMTGWNWQRRVSRWFGYDFDAIAGHSDKHTKKVDDSELQLIAEALKKVPYATIRKSTSGNGLHVYVFVDDVPTENHTEHAALARAVLDKLAFDSGCDLRMSVDVCGAVLWVWHRKMNSAPEGLRLIKQGDVLKDVPKDWRDHLEVVSGKRKKAIPRFAANEDNIDFEDLSSHRHRIKLDKEHIALIEYLQKSGGYCRFINEHNMLITHTSLLAKAHVDLSLRGFFTTLSQGSDDGDHNCFAFPLKGGAWAVRRYTKGTKESDCWEADDRRYTRAYLNKTPSFRLACISRGGIELPKGGYHFKDWDIAEKVLMVLGIDVTVPLKYRVRPGELIEQRNGKIVGHIIFQEGDSRDDMQGWLQEKKFWTRVFTPVGGQAEDPETVNHDAIIRCVVGPNDTHIGWAMRSTEKWIFNPRENIALYLRSLGLDHEEVTQALGNAISKYWVTVNRPFESEYPGNREWNRFGACLKVTPSPSGDSISHPNWDRILDHCGANLREPLKRNTWAVMNGVTTGGQYLKLWIASMIRAPYQPLPYLFFYGNQDSGKSIIHEAISLLFGRGYMKADQSLTNPGDFNGELEHAVYCYIEEQDLGKNKAVSERVKDYVTARQIMLHAKYMTPHMIPNTTHWMQFANKIDYSPTFPGDSRIVIIRVDDLDPTEIIPKNELEKRLALEAPDFLRTLMDLEIPPTDSRLNIPMIQTDEKRIAEEHNMNLVQVFITEQCFQAPGESVSLAEFFDRLQDWLDDNEKHKYGKRTLQKYLPPNNFKGKSTKYASEVRIANLSFEPVDPNGPKKLPLRIDQHGFLRDPN